MKSILKWVLGLYLVVAIITMIMAVQASAVRIILKLSTSYCWIIQIRFVMSFVA
jgi:hypothetical protein